MAYGFGIGTLYCFVHSARQTTWRFTQNSHNNITGRQSKSGFRAHRSGPALVCTVAYVRRGPLLVCMTSSLPEFHSVRPHATECLTLGRVGLRSLICHFFQTFDGTPKSMILALRSCYLSNTAGQGGQRNLYETVAATRSAPASCRPIVPTTLICPSLLQHIAVLQSRTNYLLATTSAP